MNIREFFGLVPMLPRHGDCLDIMRSMPEASVDAIVTDPPYALVSGNARYDLAFTGAGNPRERRPHGPAGGFMGKTWDAELPGVDVWREALRVAKPGAHLVAFGGTRTYHRLACALEDAGWEIRDCLSWLYGSGFPKSLDVSKAIAHRGIVPITAPATDAARQWQGWGTALKPAWEPIILARKPLAGTVAANVLEHGTGALNIDGCRIGPGHDNGRGRDGEASAERRYTDRGSVNIAAMPGPRGGDPAGRWPANLVLDEEAARMLDEQSGRRGASRFFYTAKASRRERGEGNTHPTVKPLALMRWLVRLVTPPGGLILDPFAGSGTTLLAARAEGFNAIGIEREAEYTEIARRRLVAMEVK